ncbi:phage antirepressor KilAC domain-containing protein [Nocardiopsis sp. NPDC049922]|uniref:phage antirepressor KilAC domain-containing protein n=1 Tax=Nocardiopsis sp. NPDC049922 TaxID=3155157 RepID=UPI00340289B6
MSDDLILTESRTLRSKHADRVEVLDKVKALTLMPRTMYATIEQTATYYEVHPDAVEKAIRVNREELDADGLQVLTGARLSAFKAESGLRTRAASLTLLPRRAILRVGMLLRDSYVARQVRTHLLTAERTPAVAVPQTYAQALRAAADAEEARERVQAELAVALPKAESWEYLASSEGDLSVADAAKVLSRDPAISMGRDRLFDHIAAEGWVFRAKGDGRWRAYQSAVDTGRLTELPQTYTHPKTEERVVGTPQIRITIKGLHELHRRLGAVRQLALPASGSDAA